ncbi:NAD(P)H-dependent oxidoreductase [Paenibacillus sp. P36]|uniref:NAD(P)H-dependent oxidoreductase n=1 Tax=Paenibacillus sp. P36 TaxID=3342538 RepID=UPI0038B33F4F
MAKVLYITAHPDHQNSYSLSVGDEFIKAYREANPHDVVLYLDLYQMNIPQIDSDVCNGWGKLSSGTPFHQLKKEEQNKLNRMGELVDQFVDADKYVFVNPMWNFSFPPVMKAYIDSICVAGKTFKYTNNGPIGLLKDKKAVHIQASGNFYAQGGPFAEFEIGHRHLKKIMEFFAVPSFEGIFIEGVAAKADQAPAIKEKSIQYARELAQKF